MIIFGAGLSGLIAARMLVDHSPVVMERQSSLPNNHHAVLRFRTSDVALATNVTFDKVRVIKAVHGTGNPVKDAVMYAKKATGGYSNRSILNLDPVDRYIAPPDFIQRLHKTAESSIQFGVEFRDWSADLWRDHPPVISTIPMPVMMDLFKWADKPDFKAQPGWTIKGWVREDVPCALNATVYFPTRAQAFYRVSVTGREIMVEGVGDAPSNVARARQFMIEACAYIGIDAQDVGRVEVNSSKYQKIMDLQPQERESAKRFVMWLSEHHNIFSLGRFAVWRPKLLLDDIPNDVRVIERLIGGNANYRARIEQ